MAAPAGGGMTGALGTLVESARQTLCMLRYRRSFWWMLPAVLVLFGLAFLAGARAPERISGTNIYCVFTWWALSTVVVPWTTAFLGVQSVHGELEDRTSQYLFLRPVHRVPLLLGKWLAIAFVSSLITWASAAAIYAGLWMHEERWFDGHEPHLLTTFGTTMMLGTLAYTSVAMFFGATFRRPLVWSAFFIVGLQLIAANLPVSAGLRQLTVTDPMRRMILDGIEPSRRLARALWPAERSHDLDDLGSPVTTLCVFTAICLGLACWRYARTEYESRNRD